LTTMAAWESVVNSVVYTQNSIAGKMDGKDMDRAFRLPVASVDMAARPPL
jgi:hypothetical protein